MPKRNETALPLDNDRSGSTPLFQSLPPRPDVYWGELVERDGIEQALELVMSRLSFFVGNNGDANLREGWEHLQETQNLIGEIALAVRRV